MLTITVFRGTEFPVKGRIQAGGLCSGRSCCSTPFEIPRARRSFTALGLSQKGSRRPPPDSFWWARTAARGTPVLSLHTCFWAPGSALLFIIWPEGGAIHGVPTYNCPCGPPEL